MRARKFILTLLEISVLGGLTYILINSSLDIYNTFAYDKAVLKDSPYGYSPMLSDPKDYSSMNKEIRSGEYVYVIDWLSAYNSRVVFAKVKSKMSEGYINKDLLVQTNLNILPVLSSILLVMVFVFTARFAYRKFSAV